MVPEYIQGKDILTMHSYRELKRLITAAYTQLFGTAPSSVELSMSGKAASAHKDCDRYLVDITGTDDGTVTMLSFINCSDNTVHEWKATPIACMASQLGTAGYGTDMNEPATGTEQEYSISEIDDGTVKTQVWTAETMEDELSAYWNICLNTVLEKMKDRHLPWVWICTVSDVQLIKTDGNTVIAFDTLGRPADFTELPVTKQLAITAEILEDNCLMPVLPDITDNEQQ